MRTTTQVAAISGSYDHQKVRPFPPEDTSDTPFITLELHDHPHGIVPAVQLFFGPGDLTAVRELIVNLGRVKRFLEAATVQATVEDLQQSAVERSEQDRSADLARAEIACADAGIDVDDVDDVLVAVDQGIPVDEAIARLAAAQATS